MDIVKPKQKTGRLKRLAGVVLQGTGQLLWPAACVNCRQSISQNDSRFCAACWGQLLESTAGDYCRRCGRDASKYAILEGRCPDCVGKEIHFDAIARCGVYEQNLRKMVLAFKNGKTELDSALGFLADGAMSGSGFAGEIDFFVPVPLHWSRRLIRGYNQSLVLARRLNWVSSKINTDLVRIRRTKTQPTMTTPACRVANVAGAFAVRYGHGFSGRSVCLIDDIKTTGATLNECAKILKEAGTAKVFALVLAVAGQSN